MPFAYTTQQPSPDLRPFVHAYGCFFSLDAGAAPPCGEGFLADDDPLTDGLFACAHFFLHFNLGEPYALCYGGAEVLVKDRAHFIGPATRPGRMRLPKRVRLFGVFFRPGWAQHFLRVPAGELTDRCLGLGHFWGAAGRALEGRVLEAATLEERVRHVEAELRRRLAAAPPPDRTVPALAEHVLGLGGRTTARALGALSGFTRQHLARKFRDCVGISPKLFCRLTRFQQALDRAAASPPQYWAAAAVELGYYDQAHLIAEFKEFAGLTPTGFTSLR
jgi:AraC-like DNA-binding protein